jgi:hypothetical protein
MVRSKNLPTKSLSTIGTFFFHLLLPDVKGAQECAESPCSEQRTAFSNVTSDSNVTVAFEKQTDSKTVAGLVKYFVYDSG